MSETTHTPGPWQLVKQEGEDWGVDLVVRMGDAIDSPGAHDAAHAFTYYEGLEPEGQDEEWVGKVLANAHLIAAAPELYDALAAAWERVHSDVCGHTCCKECENAKSAMAKARGL